MVTLDTYGQTDAEISQKFASGQPTTYGITGVCVEHEGMTYRQWLVPGFRYEIRPQGGWELFGAEGALIGRLVEESGGTVSKLPTADGSISLERPNSYAIREAEAGAWEVLMLERAK
ncbi:MAG: hypothetical protein H0T78_09575 [Longispora sp.]|nr:hypothetical protein [Longispora sp. (in: high G+C Gram-positive bacteria)]